MSRYPQMITTRRAPRTQRPFAAALVLSVVIHLFGGALWAHTSRLVAQIMRRLPEQQPREEVATSDVVHLERRTIPRPARASRARPQPRPRPAQTPHRPAEKQIAVVPRPPAAKPVRHAPKPALSAAPELAHRSVHAPRHAPHPDGAKVDIAKAAAAPPAAANQAALSAAQLAQLNAQFAQTIAASHVDLATIQEQAEERPVAVKRYPMQFTGLQARLQRGEGYIEPTTMGQRIGDTMWYYTHYTYMWPDGHLEDDDIPWPFHYPVQHDLFALHVHLIPLQLPPPGFRLTRALKPFLAHFVQSAGQG
jgi:hypothetical protein